MGSAIRVGYMSAGDDSLRELSNGGTNTAASGWQDAQL